MTHPRPWHRSRLFWLGLPGLLFLLWAWFLLDSYWLVRWTRPFGYTQVAYQTGAIFINHSFIDSPNSRIPVGIDPYLPSAQGFIQQTGPVSRAHRNYFTWPPSHRVANTFANTPDHYTRRITIPFLLLVPLYLALWLTTLLLWQRRKHRHLLEKTPP